MSGTSDERLRQAHSDLLLIATSWEPDAKLLGNVSALEIECLMNQMATWKRDLDAAEAEVQRLLGEINKPQTQDWIAAVKLEAAHQRERWGAEHDAGKAPADWFWLIGYLAGKALQAAVTGDREKALHHTISTAAVLANWHLALAGADNRMRPGTDRP